MSAEVLLGWMGRTLPGWRPEVLEHAAGVPAPAYRPGRLAVDVPASRLKWFTGYSGPSERAS